MMELIMPGYTAPATYWIDDKTVSAENYKNRSYRSLMPKENMGKSAKEFNWKLYDADLTLQKKILNAFIVSFEKFRRNGQGLYITSRSVGSGKTLLGCITANEVMKRNRDVSVKYTTAKEYTELLKEKSDEKTLKKREIDGCTLLILDDLGEKQTEWEKGVIRDLVDYRAKYYRPCIYISSVNIEQLPENQHYTDMIATRSSVIELPDINIRRRLDEVRQSRFLEGAMQESAEAVF